MKITAFFNSQKSATILPPLIIFSLLVFYFFNNLLWVSLNQTPPVDDEAFHLNAVIDCYNILKDTAKTFIEKGRMLLGYSVIDVYPPLLHVIAAVVSLIFGMTTTVSIMTNMFFIFVSFISIYLIGKKMANTTVGLLAVFIFSMYPLIFWLSRVFLIETALCAVVTASLAALMYTENFTKTSYSIIFGILCGLGMFTKQLFIFSIIGPLFMTVIYSLLAQAQRKTRLKILLNILFPFFSLTAVFYAWYLPKLNILLPSYIKVGYVITRNIPYPIFSPESIMFYPKLFLEENLLPFFGIIFYIALIVFIFKKNRYKIFLLSWPISVWLAFTLIKAKYIYYAGTVLPVAALISAIWLGGPRKHLSKILVIMIIILGGLSQYFLISYGNKSLSRIRAGIKIGEHKIISLGVMPRFPLLGNMVPYIQRGNWKINEIFRSLEEKSDNKKKLVLGMTNYGSLSLVGGKNIGRHDYITTVNKEGLIYQARLRGLPYVVFDIYSFCFMRNGRPHPPEVDFLLSILKIEQLDIKPPGNYILIDIFQLPDKSEVFLYKNKKNLKKITIF